MAVDLIYPVCDGEYSRPRSSLQTSETVALLSSVLRFEADDFVERCCRRFDSKARVATKGALFGPALTRTLDAVTADGIKRLVDEWWAELGTSALAYFLCIPVQVAGRQGRVGPAPATPWLNREPGPNPETRLCWFRPVAIAQAKLRFRTMADHLIGELTEFLVDYLQANVTASGASGAARKQPPASVCESPDRELLHAGA